MSPFPTYINTAVQVFDIKLVNLRLLVSISDTVWECRRNRNAGILFWIKLILIKKDVLVFNCNVHFLFQKGLCVLMNFEKPISH